MISTMLSLKPILLARYTLTLHRNVCCLPSDQSLPPYSPAWRRNHYARKTPPTRALAIKGLLV